MDEKRRRLAGVGVVTLKSIFQAIFGCVLRGVFAVGGQGHARVEEVWWPSNSRKRWPKDGFERYNMLVLIFEFEADRGTSYKTAQILNSLRVVGSKFNICENLINFFGFRASHLNERSTDSFHTQPDDHLSPSWPSQGVDHRVNQCSIPRMCRN